MKQLLMMILLACVGCQGVKRTYDVSVKNDSSQAVTVWLTKNGPPWEDGWKSPEDLALESPKVDEKIGGVVVPPGKSAATGTRTGEFARSTDAVLRVYHGQRLFTDMLAISKGSPSRTDVILKPGKNEVTVTDEGTRQKVSLNGVAVPRE